jgi:hypothetical protein
MAADPTVKKFPYRTNLVKNATLTRYPALQGGEVHYLQQDGLTTLPYGVFTLIKYDILKL